MSICFYKRKSCSKYSTTRQGGCICTSMQEKNVHAGEVLDHAFLFTASHFDLISFLRHVRIVLERKPGNTGCSRKPSLELRMASLGWRPLLSGWRPLLYSTVKAIAAIGWRWRSPFRLPAERTWHRATATAQVLTSSDRLFLWGSFLPTDDTEDEECCKGDETARELFVPYAARSCGIALIDFSIY